MLKLRTAFAGLSAVVIAALPFHASVTAASAQNFTKQVTIIVPYAPGGTSDILARLMAPKLSEAIGQPVIVENKPSSSGNIGADFVAKAPGDGHTLADHRCRHARDAAQSGEEAVLRRAEGSGAGLAW